VDGSKVRTFTCCQGELGARGCSRGPHVFKEESFQELHQRIPFVELDDKSEGHMDVVALDCEMSYTMGGMELVRVTIVDWNGKTLLDELCKTQFPVLDLNTRFSGIVSLDSARYDFESLRTKIKSLISNQSILIGHGLENDLKAMRILSTKVIDTAALFKHPKGFPFRYSLKALVQQHLGKFIQRGSQGHDAFEDASSAIDLVKHQLQKQ
jgi:RNA exonuclease 1